MELLTYLQDNLKDNKLIRWPEHCFPLRFYIAPFRWYAQRGNDDYRYQAMVRRALGEWEKVSGGKVKFKIVQTLNESQVNLDWKRVIEGLSDIAIFILIMRADFTLPRCK